MHHRIASWGLALSMCISAAPPALAQANLLSNGSFETPSLGASPYISYAVGSTGILGWSVISPGVSNVVHVTVIDTGFTQNGFSFPAYDGNQWLDLTGATPSDNDHEGVEQVVPTRAGSTYTLSFEIGNVFDGSGVFGSSSSVELYIDGTLVGTYTNDAVATTQEWRPFTYSLTATGPWTRIGLVSADPHTDNHNGLDDVQLTLAAAAAPRDGDLDDSFGTDGAAFSDVTDGVPNSFSRPVLQADSKIVLCGQTNNGAATGKDFLVVRHTADGALDESFSFDGHAVVDFGSSDEICNAVAVQADGKIVVAGTTHGPVTTDFAVARLNPDGSLDTGFGNHGKVVVDFMDAMDLANAVAIQADGKIVVAGASGGDPDFALVRLTSDGALDTSFDADGRLTIPFHDSGNHADSAAAVAIDTAGRIVVAGTVSDSTGSDFAVARVLSDGTLDADFDVDGRVTVGFDVGQSGQDVLHGMTIQSNGRIVLAGQADVSPTATQNFDWAIARLRPDGTLDTGFGSGGKTYVPFDLVTGGLDLATGVDETADGKLLVVGEVGAYAVFHSGAARLDANGQIDSSFGDGGVRVYEFPSSSSIYASALFGIADDGAHAVVSGLALRSYDVATDTATFDTFVARLLEGDVLFANGFD